MRNISHPSFLPPQEEVPERSEGMEVPLSQGEVSERSEGMRGPSFSGGWGSWR